MDTDARHPAGPLLTVDPPRRASHSKIAAVRRLAAALSAAYAFASAPALAVEEPAPFRHTDVQVADEHSSGRYGDPGSTRIDSATVVARRRLDVWQFEAQVPWLDVRTTAGPGGLPDSLGRGSSHERGLGDIVLLVTRELIPFVDDRTELDATLKVKTKSGDLDRGLGSGATDVALQIDAVRRLGDWIAFAQAGYRRTGDVPGFPKYRNPWSAEIGGFRRFDSRWETGATWDVRQAIGRLGPLREATGFVALRIDGLQLQLYATKGFATASPDWAVGVSLRQRF